MNAKKSLSHKKPGLLSDTGLPKMLLTLDMFGEPLPMFNIKGKSDVRTHCGGCLSIAIIFSTVAFALTKLEHLLERHNPTVNIFTIDDAYDETDVWRAED